MRCSFYLSLSNLRTLQVSTTRGYCFTCDQVGPRRQSNPWCTLHLLFLICTSCYLLLLLFVVCDFNCMIVVKCFQASKDIIFLWLKLNIYRSFLDCWTSFRIHSLLASIILNNLIEWPPRSLILLSTIIKFYYSIYVFIMLWHKVKIISCSLSYHFRQENFGIGRPYLRVSVFFY